jgi:lipopolysaccharide transport system permease protein
MPLSNVFTNRFNFGIQLLVLFVSYVYVVWRGIELSPNLNLLILPVYILTMAMLGLGMIISVFTTKYRDLTVLVGFATSLLIYLSAVSNPLSEVEYKMLDYPWIVQYNPLTQIIEGFRYMILYYESFTWLGFTYTLLISIFLFGLVIFNRTEKNFIDTV